MKYKRTYPSPFGWVLLDGYRLPITSMRLTRGTILFEYELKGPLPPLKGHVTVFGDDGRGIWQGHEVSYPAIKDGVTWVCQYSLTMDTVTSWDDQQDFTMGSP